MQTRDIWTIRIVDQLGRDGYGEIAPLEGLSTELNDQFESKLKEVASNISYFLANKPDLISYPSILFGIESAWLSYKNRDFVFYDTPFTRGEREMPINALVWMGDYASMQSQIATIIESGASCIKLKIGALDFQKEVELIQYIRNIRTESELSIRLDANGAFDVETALDKIKVLAQFQIHSIEQPIKAGQHDVMRNIIAESPIPIALDEELIGSHSYKQKYDLIRLLQPHYIVLKPSLHGGLLGAEEWIFVANTHKVKWWTTSALESNIGLNVLAQWSSRYDQSYEFHQGLGTGNLYKNNFPSHLELESYRLRMA